jgi:hypothetical protein
MCSYDGYHGTFNVTQQCHSMKSGVCPKRENNGRNYTKWNIERGSEVMKFKEIFLSNQSIFSYKRSAMKNTKHLLN